MMNTKQLLEAKTVILVEYKEYRIEEVFNHLNKINSSKKMKCQVCNMLPAQEHSVVCSTHCERIRLEVLRLIDKYAPTNGCENCLEDLGIGCTKECRNEFKKVNEFVPDLYQLIRMTLDNNLSPAPCKPI